MTKVMAALFVGLLWVGSAHAQSVTPAPAAGTSTVQASNTPNTNSGTACAGLTNPERLPARLQPANLKTMLQGVVEGKRTAGIAVGIVTPQGTCFVSAGQSGNPARPELDTDSLFEIGSITKAYTGALLADMVSKGELKLDEAIGPHLPEKIRSNASLSAVTFKQLTTHTSGIPRIPLTDMNMLKSMMEKPDDPYVLYTREHLLAYLADLKVSSPAKYDYSNTAVALLGLLLEQRAGKPYEQLLQERLFKDIGLNNTYLTVPQDMAARMTQGHTPQGKPTPAWSLGVFAPAGSLKSSVSDQIKLIQAVLSKRQPWALSQEQINPLGKVGGIGYGWHIARLLDANGKRDSLAWHNGGTFGATSFIGMDVERGFGVVVLLNTGALGLADEVGLHLWDERMPAPKPQAVASMSTVKWVVLGAAMVSGVVLAHRTWITHRDSASGLTADPSTLSARGLASVFRWNWPFRSKLDALHAALQTFTISGVIAVSVPQIALPAVLVIKSMSSWNQVAIGLIGLLCAAALWSSRKQALVHAMTWSQRIGLGFTTLICVALLWLFVLH